MDFAQTSMKSFSLICNYVDKYNFNKNSLDANINKINFTSNLPEMGQS